MRCGKDDIGIFGRIRKGIVSDNEEVEISDDIVDVFVGIDLIGDRVAAYTYNDFIG